MDLTEYEGASPATDASATVEHVTHHRRWSPKRESRDDCPNCGEEFELADRHVLVTLTRGNADAGERHYFCDAACVGEWLNGDAT
ncbi:DUF7576 family protein [Halobacterium litoreum]|uniref:Small CPxCG-related zinc finger protein n=1 Tax=Halobacterium litoreum TaxID=2039234 RepID=A0ABD5NI88_9EURY|nr:hypothetical protein [Halobacterium litoreum]UHH12361.1 hypothetical protein LT972_09345 [Halobacterium litoreum]